MQTPSEEEKVPGGIVGSHWFSADLKRYELFTQGAAMGENGWFLTQGG